jgi:hypothetical protein
MITTEEDGKRCLDQYISTLTECIEDGFKRYFKLPPKALVDFTPRSRASIINDFIRAEARKRFYDIPSIQLYEIRGLFLLDFGEIQLRFKKLDKQLRPHNIPTNQTRIFMVQGQLPGLPMATKVIAGYQPNVSYSDIEYMGILCPDNNGYLWQIDLNKISRSPIPLERPETDMPNIEKGNVTLKEGVENGNKSISAFNYKRKKNI